MKRLINGSLLIPFLSLPSLNAEVKWNKLPNKINNQIRAQLSDDGSQRHVLIQGGLGEIIFARNYDAKKERAEEVSIEMFTNSKLSTRIIAENLFWNKHDWIAV